MRYISIPDAALGIEITPETTRYTQRNDLQALLWLAGFAQGPATHGSIVEIGCNEGRTTKELAVRFPDVKVIGIDWSENHRLHEDQGHERLSTERIGWMAKGLENVEIINADSASVAYEQFLPISLCFIDGDHTYQGVKRDTEPVIAAMSSLNLEDTFVVWHDYESPSEFVGVTKYINGLNLPHTYHIRGTLIAFKVFNPSKGFLKYIEQYKCS